MRDFLRKVPLFSDLSSDDLEQLCQLVGEVRLAANEELFREGSVGDKAYVIQEGELEIIKTSQNREVLLAVRGRGEVIGELAMLEEKPRMATVRARTDSLLLTIHWDQLRHLMHTSVTAAETMFFTVLSRWQATESQLRQSEKMAHLGTLSAGIAHELNNPAAAVKRGAVQLEGALDRMSESFIHLVQMNLEPEQWTALNNLTRQAREQAKRPPEMDALARSDQEYAFEEWLESQNVADAWELAPLMVNLNLGDDDRIKLAAGFKADDLRCVIDWLNANYETFNLMAEQRQGAGRISEIVKALKSYSYLDQAPVQNVDIHEGLDNTLLILRHKLKSGINVRREYDPQLPIILGYGSELNQVWTNIIDNAIDAMDGQGELTLRTRQEEGWVVVELRDNGTGIPPEVQTRMFEPFFTTKPPGAGTGLGLDISYNIVVQKHRGDIKVYSKPGNTCFEVWLPRNFESRSTDPQP